MGCLKSKQTVDQKDNFLHKSSFVLKNTGSHLSRYKIGKLLGQGAFGRVNAAQDKTSGEKVAIKYIEKKNINKAQKEVMLREVDVLAKMDHPNIVRIVGFYDENKKFCIVQELVTGGELFEKLVQKKKFNESDCIEIMKRILGAVNYCHIRGIVHRDLKPENVLLDGGDCENYSSLKLVDFGTAVKYNQKKMTSLTGTSFYIAPEVVAAGLEGGKAYTNKCDIWSIGVICFIILSGKMPFFGKTNDDIFAMGKKPVVFPTKEWQMISPSAKAFVDFLLTISPNKRPSADEAMQHPWLKSLADPKADQGDATHVLSHLQAFKTTNTLQKAAYAYIGSQLATDQDRKKIDAVFRSLDSENNGKLSKKEIKEGYWNHYGKVIPEEELSSMMTNLDLAGDGYISYTEFIAASLSSDTELGEKRINDAFDMFDTDKSGYIKVHELRAIFHCETGDKKMDAVIEEIIAKVDTGGTKEISRQEFVRMMHGEEIKHHC